MMPGLGSPSGDRVVLPNSGRPVFAQPLRVFSEPLLGGGNRFCVEDKPGASGRCGRPGGGLRPAGPPIRKDSTRPQTAPNGEDVEIEIDPITGAILDIEEDFF